MNESGSENVFFSSADGRAVSGVGESTPEMEMSLEQKSELELRGAPEFELKGAPESDVPKDVFGAGDLLEAIPESVVSGRRAAAENPRFRAENVRLESVHTSPFLLGLAGALEKFLDIFGEPFELSPEKNLSANPVRKRPKTFQGGGFAVTFPFAEGLGAFLIAERGGILPSWFADPGIAGKSRIFLLANELERLFGPEFLTETTSETSAETSETSETPSKTSETSETSAETSEFVGVVGENADFYESSLFFYGQIESLEALFEALPMDETTDFRSFAIRKFDGREGSAWMLGPFRSANIFHRSRRVVSAHVSVPLGGLKPVRSLEAVTIEPLSLVPTILEPEIVEVAETSNALEEVVPESIATEVVLPESVTTEVVVPESVATEVVLPESVAQEEAAPESVTTEEAAPESVTTEEGEPESVAQTEDETEEDGASALALLSDFFKCPNLVFRFHFRTICHSPRLRAEREERILSQIRYSHPANTQVWRSHSERLVQQYSAELEGLLATVSWRGQTQIQAQAQIQTQIPSSVPVFPVAGISSAVPTISIVETQIPLKAQDLTDVSVQIVDFGQHLEKSNCEELQSISVTCFSPEEWTENSFVVARTIEPPVGREQFTAESLLEAEPEAEKIAAETEEPASETSLRSPFARDFALESSELMDSGEPVNTRKVLEIPVSVSVLLGRSRLLISELMEWKIGTILNLGQKVDKSSEVFLNGGCAGSGFPIEYDHRVGVRLEDVHGF